MGRPAGNIEKVEIDDHVKVAQRTALCYHCGAQYIGEKELVTCRGCKRELKTENRKAFLIIPTGQWILNRDKPQISNSHIVGEIPADGGG